MRNWSSASIGYQNLAGLHAHLGALAASADAAAEALAAPAAPGTSKTSALRWPFRRGPPICAAMLAHKRPAPPSLRPKLWNKKSTLKSVTCTACAASSTLTTCAAWARPPLPAP